MVHKGDSGPTLIGEEMFELKQIVDSQQMANVVDQKPDVVAESEDEDETPRPKFQKYNKEDSHLDSSGLYYKDSDSEVEMETDEEEDNDKIREGLGRELLL